jgi:hypothetical protein
MSDTLTRPTGIIELKPLENNVRDSTVQIGWCLSKQLTDELAQMGAVRPMLLITVVNIRQGKYHTDSTETTRHLVPLALGQTFVSFSRAGLNRVFATIVWSRAGDEKALRRIYLARESSMAYETNIVGYNAERIYDKFSVAEPHDGRHPAVASFDVDVPNGVFARPPRQWWSLFQAKLFRDKPFDQCHSRKRFLWVGWWLVPLFLLTTLPVRIIWVIIRLFLGIMPTDIKAAVRPFRYRVRDIAGPDKYSVWFCKKEKVREDGKLVHAEQPFWRWIINPPVQTVLWLGVYDLGPGSVGALDAVLFSIGGQLVLVVGITLVVVIGLLFRRLARLVVPKKRRSDKESRKFRKQLAEQRRLREAIANARAAAPREQELLQTLVCSTDTPVPPRDTRQLPRELRYKLWYDRTKNRVCKPYQR